MIGVVCLNNRAGSSISWYSYSKPNRINFGTGDYSEFKYGPGRSRFKQTTVESGATTTTYYVGGRYEREIAGGVTTHRHSVLANGKVAAIVSRPSSGSVTTVYPHRDHLSSIVKTTNGSGAVLDSMSFDAFGKRRNANWTADNSDLLFNGSSSLSTKRGYTGHEHLDVVRLVHMNGRLQDPIIGRMISADILIPNVFDSQTYNRYSYVMNRPLSVTDPSGYMPFFGNDNFTFIYTREQRRCDSIWDCPGKFLKPSTARKLLARGGWTNAVDEYFPEGTWRRAVADFGILDSIQGAEDLLEAIETGNTSVIAANIAGLACDLGKACKAVSRAISKIPGAKKAAAGIKKFFGRLKDKISGKSVPNGGPPRNTDGTFAKVDGPTAGKPVDSATRQRMLDRDRNADGSWTCATCGQSTKNPANIHAGHIKARFRGGDLSDGNLRCEGAVCNLSQGAGSAPKPGRTCAERGSCGAPYGRTD